MFTLLINTAGDEAQVSLISKKKIIDELIWVSSPDIGKEVLVNIKKILSSNNTTLCDITRIAVHAGPSKRSSALRAGITIASTLSFALKCDLVAVTSPKKTQLIRDASTMKPSKTVKPDYHHKPF